jgi:integrase
LLEAWYVDIQQRVPGRDDVRHRERSPVNTKNGALGHERAIRQAIADGSWFREQQQQEAPTFSAFVEQFLTYSENNNKFATVEAKRSLLELHLVPHFGAMKLENIGPADVEAFKAAMRKKQPRARVPQDGATRSAVLRRYGKGSAPLSAKTTNNALACLRKMLTVAEEYGVVKAAPKVRLLKTSSAAFDFLDFDEAEQLIEAFDEDFRAAALLAIKGGLRLGELVGLQWADLDLARGSVTVRRNVYRGRVQSTPKGGRAREVQLPTSVVDALRPLRNLKTWVFADAAGAFLSVKKFDRALNAAVRRAGIVREDGRVGWHDLRHTYGSHLAMRGVTLPTIRDLMGHADIRTTMKYAHLMPSHTRAAVQVLDEPAPALHAAPLAAHERHTAAGPAVLPADSAG